MVIGMKDVIYILDSNIIINIWNSKINILDELIKNNNINFLIPKEVAKEISEKEFIVYQGTSVLSDRFLKLLPYIEEELNKEKINDFCYKIKAKKLLSGIYYVNGNKLSKTDFMLLYLCSINENSVIVTEDKKLLKASKEILGNNKSINLKEFLIRLN